MLSTSRNTWKLSNGIQASWFQHFKQWNQSIERTLTRSGAPVPLTLVYAAASVGIDCASVYISIVCWQSRLSLPLSAPSFTEHTRTFGAVPRRFQLWSVSDICPIIDRFARRRRASCAIDFDRCLCLLFSLLQLIFVNSYHVVRRYPLSCAIYFFWLVLVSLARVHSMNHHLFAFISNISLSTWQKTSPQSIVINFKTVQHEENLEEGYDWHLMEHIINVWSNPSRTHIIVIGNWMD